jgi:hypothetical protein
MKKRAALVWAGAVASVVLFVARLARTPALPEPWSDGRGS